MTGRSDHHSRIIDYIFVLLGCMILSFAITSILKPNGLVTGGLPGISIILEKLIHIRYTYIYYTLSIIVLSVSGFILGKEEIVKIVVI